MPYPLNKHNRIDWDKCISFYVGQFDISLSDFWDNDFKTLDYIVEGKKKAMENQQMVIMYGVASAYKGKLIKMFKDKVDPNKEKEMKDSLTKTFGL